MTAPTGLGPRGRSLWKSITEGLPEHWELDEREVEILTLAARQADDLEALEKAIRDEGTMATGSKGQPVLHPAVGEAGQAHLTISRLLGALSLPDEERAARTQAGLRGQRAAWSRWDRHRARRGAA